MHATPGTGGAQWALAAMKKAVMAEVPPPGRNVPGPPLPGSAHLERLAASGFLTQQGSNRDRVPRPLPRQPLKFGDCPCCPQEAPPD